jgi:hypothetical protein
MPFQVRCRFGALCALGFAGLWLGLAPAAQARDPREDAEDTRPPMRVVIGLDLSKSNPLVDSKSYASSVAGIVAEEVADLPMASIVMLRTFGSYDSDSNNLRIDRTISNEADEKPASVASFIEEIVASIPRLVNNGRLDAQDSTNVVAFLENMSEFVDCGDMDTSVILVSDGIEASEYAQLKRAGEHLPKPSRMYAGCSQLEIIGLGQGQASPSVTERLREEWAAWAKAAGFKSFNGYNSW